MEKKFSVELKKIYQFDTISAILLGYWAGRQECEGKIRDADTIRGFRKRFPLTREQMADNTLHHRLSTIRTVCRTEGDDIFDDV